MDGSRTERHFGQPSGARVAVSAEDPLAVGPLLTPEHVAQLCGLSRRAVYDAIRRGELPAMRLCSRLRIRSEDLDAWLTSARVTPQDSPLPVTELRTRPLPPGSAGSFRALMATATTNGSTEGSQP